MILEAAERLPEVQAMAESGGRPLDSVRVVGLESQIAAGFGRRVETEELLDRVRIEFLSREIAFDTAVATLELGRADRGGQGDRRGADPDLTELARGWLQELCRAAERSRCTDVRRR